MIERFNALGGGGWSRCREGKSTFIRFLDEAGKHKLIAVACHGSDEHRFSGIVLKCPAKRADGLAQRAVRHDDVGPDAIENQLAVHGFVPVLDQEDEEVEVARNERLLNAFAQQHSPAGRQHEVCEAKARQAA